MSDTDLQDALQELIESGERPDAEALEDIVARHPQHATELTDFAVEWALQELLPKATSSAADASAVPAAMQQFQARLAELDREAGTVIETPPSVSDPFADRTPAELKRVASALGLDKTLVAKLRDRKIVAESVPAELSEGLANELEVPVTAILAHLSQPAAIHPGVSFKAAGKPEAGPKETFVVAVQRSFLDAQQKDRWQTSSPTEDPTLND